MDMLSKTLLALCRIVLSEQNEKTIREQDLKTLKETRDWLEAKQSLEKNESK